MEVRPGYKLTEIGVIPETWDCIPFSKFVAIQRGHDLTTRQRRLGIVPVMGSAGKNGYHDTAIAHGPGVVIGRSGASFGQAHWCEIDFWPHNTALYVTDFFGNDPRFAFYALRETDFSRHNSGGAQQSLNRNFIAGVLLARPPRPEQVEVRKCLDDIDAAICALSRLITKKRDLRTGAMQRLLTGQTRLLGFTAPWQEKRLGELGRFLKGSGVPRGEALSGELPCIRYGEIYTTHHNVIRQFTSRISRAVANNATRIQFRDLLFAGSGETKAEIGKCVALTLDVEAYAGGDIIILRPGGGNPVFLGYLMNIPQVAQQKANRGQGDAVVHISAKALAAVEVRLPNETEQEAIAEVLSDMDAEIAALEARLAKIRALKQAMMQALLTGRVRLPVATGTRPELEAARA